MSCLSISNWKGSKVRTPKCFAVWPRLLFVKMSVLGVRPQHLAFGAGAWSDSLKFMDDEWMIDGFQDGELQEMDCSHPPKKKHPETMVDCAMEVRRDCRFSYNHGRWEQKSAPCRVDGSSRSSYHIKWSYDWGNNHPDDLGFPRVSWFWLISRYVICADAD